MDPRVVELLARLSAATVLGDETAAARIIDELARSDQGGWLVRQFCAAGLRRLASDLTRA